MPLFFKIFESLNPQHRYFSHNMSLNLASRHENIFSRERIAEKTMRVLVGNATAVL